MTGDASATTIWNNWEWEKEHPGDKSLPPHRIHAILPDAKILVILRDPIKRLISDFLYFGNPNKTIDDREAFQEKVLQGIAWLDNCFSQHSRSHCTFSPIENESSYGWNWSPPVRLRLGLYAEFLEAWLAVFPQNQVHIELLDDYSVDKLPVLNRIFTFLGVGELPDYRIEVLNANSVQVKNSVSTDKYKDFGKVNDVVMDSLHKFYDPFNKKLSTMLNRTLPWGCVYSEC